MQNCRKVYGKENSNGLCGWCEELNDPGTISVGKCAKINGKTTVGWSWEDDTMQVNHFTRLRMGGITRFKLGKLERKSIYKEERSEELFHKLLKMMNMHNNR